MNEPITRDAAFEAVVENRDINQWIGAFSRHPLQINQPHQSDAELIRIGGSAQWLAATTDAFHEEIEHGLYRDPYSIGWVATMANFSDLAAVGAEPLGFLIASTWPPGTAAEFKASVARGIEEACRALGTHLLGGDTNEGRTLSLTGCALGLVEKSTPVMRTGMAPGHYVFLSYPAGAGNLFAMQMLTGAGAEGDAKEPYRPRARLREGKLLAAHASSCIDTSDGVFCALDQLLRLNRVGIEIGGTWADVLVRACREVPAIPSAAFLAGIHGEYELLFSVPPERLDAFLSAAHAAEWSPIPLGKVIGTPQARYRGAAVDLLFFRNLWDEMRHDVQAYASSLLRRCREIG